jgi:hypothetical protein
MPNHITNILLISGDNSRETILEINRLKQMVNNNHQNFSIENYIPMPTDVDTRMWRIKNWGTKWDVYEVSEWEYIISDIKPLFLKISFQSAWSTPIVAILKLSKLFPTLRIECKFADEDTGSNCGMYVFKNGDLINEEVYPTITSHSKRFAESIYNESNKLLGQ